MGEGRTGGVSVKVTRYGRRGVDTVIRFWKNDSPDLEGVTRRAIDTIGSREKQGTVSLAIETARWKVIERGRKEGEE